jgi:hypothetical protein
MKINAPSSINVGKPVSITVSDGKTGEPLFSSRVYCINTALLPPHPSVSPEWERLATTYGFFINRTKGNGQVNHIFRESGNYMLIAVKEGRTPAVASVEVTPPE